MWISLWGFVFVSVVAARSVSKREVVDFNNPVTLGEAIFAMFSGELQFPQYDPHNLPEMTFKCEEQALPGYYADTELECQVVHQCDQQNGISGIHICPNMTVFNQEYFTCMWAPTVDCANAPTFYSLNENLYKGPNVDLWGNGVITA